MQLLADFLVRRGHNVSYITKGSKKRMYPSIDKTVINGVQVYVFNLLPGAGKIHFIKILNNYLFEYYARSIIVNSEVKIIYSTYHQYILNHLYMLRKHLADIKVVVRVGGMLWYEMCINNKRLIKSYEELFNNVDAVNYNNKELENLTHEKFQQLNMDVKFKYEFTADIGSALQTERPYPYEKLNNSTFKIMMATRFSDYQKRHDIIVRAASLIKPDLKLHIKLIGEGPERIKIEKMIDQLKVGERVTVVPFMQQHDLWKEMLETDLLCHACDYEGLSKIIIESMTMGLPVLVSNVVPLNSYVFDGYNGFLVDNDPASWARKIEHLIDDKHIRVNVSLNAIKYAKKHYNPNKNVELYESHFNRIIGS